MSNTEFQNLRQLLETRTTRFAEKIFLIDQASGREYSYLEFDRIVNQTANLLLSLGAEKGDRVSLFLSNRVEYLFFYFACFKIGAWAGPVNALLTAAEVEFVIGNSEAKIAVTEAALLPVLSEARQNLRTVEQLIVVDASGSASAVDYYAAIADQADTLKPVDTSGDDEAMIIYTSGTTGKPKGVMLTHRNLLSNARQIAGWLQLTERDRSLIIMPLFHVNALMTTGLAVLWAGASIVLAAKFSASNHWQIIAKYGVSYYGSVATMLSILNNTFSGGLRAGVDTHGLRFALCGSAPVPAEVMRRHEALFNCPVVEGYGLSESTCRSTFNRIDDRRPGSIGEPIGNEMKVFDEKDNELGPGQVGEIVLRGDNIMKGYFKNRAATEEAFRSGWFHTGDLGYRDEEGRFYVVDRKSDMIIRGGENIYPREIDEVLYTNPKVKDAATIGVPDDLYGEEVKSFVVLRDGETATEDEFLGFCGQRLAAFKCPKSIAFLEEIPKGPTGKLLRRELAKMFDSRGMRDADVGLLRK